MSFTQCYNQYNMFSAIDNFLIVLHLFCPIWMNKVGFMFSFVSQLLVFPNNSILSIISLISSNIVSIMISAISDFYIFYCFTIEWNVSELANFSLASIKWMQEKSYMIICTFDLYIISQSHHSAFNMQKVINIYKFCSKCLLIL